MDVVDDDAPPEAGDELGNEGDKQDWVLVSGVTPGSVPDLVVPMFVAWKPYRPKAPRC